MSDLIYVYAVVPRSTVVAGAPEGVDDAPLATVPEGDVAALVSQLSAAYGAGLDDRLGDVAWLGPRATAHDAVLTWASDAGPVVPLPLLSLFRSEDAVRAMLRERHAEVTALLARVGRGREYGVRVFRVDDELRGVLADYSSVVSELTRRVERSASPGQAYLLSRKLEAATKEEIGTVSREVATRSFELLSARSLEAVEDPLPTPLTEHAGVAVLNASFLVAHAGVDDFRGAVTELVRAYDGRGFRIEFTGPWPPYHFARSAAAAHGAATETTS